MSGGNGYTRCPAAVSAGHQSSRLVFREPLAISRWPPIWILPNATKRYYLGLAYERQSLIEDAGIPHRTTDGKAGGD